MEKTVNKTNYVVNADTDLYLFTYSLTFSLFENDTE